MARILGSEPFEAVLDFAYDWEHGTTAAQVEAAARSCGPGLERYVFISSVAAYGEGLGLHEDAPLAPDDFPMPYIQHKASAERALFAMHRESGFPVTTFRPPFGHGPRQPFYREQFFWDRMLDGRPIILPDGGDAPMQWVYVSDVAEACVRAIEVPEAAGEAFNVGHVEPTTQRSFVEALARAAGAEPTPVPVARSAIQAAGGQVMGENLYFGEVLDMQPLTSVVDKAARVLGLEPTPLDEGARRGLRLVPRAAPPSRRLRLRGSAPRGGPSRADRWHAPLIFPLTIWKDPGAPQPVENPGDTPIRLIRVGPEQ
jgi:2'-hydroxyisoflavone reductase